MSHERDVREPQKVLGGSVREPMGSGVLRNGYKRIKLLGGPYERSLVVPLAVWQGGTLEVVLESSLFVPAVPGHGTNATRRVGTYQQRSNDSSLWDWKGWSK